MSQKAGDSPQVKLPTAPDEPGADTVNPKTGAVKRLYKDAKQAHSAYQNLKKQNGDRNRKNALIQQKLNNQPPYDSKKLKSSGEDWRSNRPTGFISMMLNRVKPPYKQIVDSAKSLTFAKWPGPEGPETEKKTDSFRNNITKTVRKWPGFNDFNSQLIHENMAFGYAAAGWDDPYEWRPDFMRQDQVFFPMECPQTSVSVPIFARLRRYQIHELLPVLENPELRKTQGWNIKNLIKAINAAVPTDRTIDDSTDARRLEDWIREGGYGSSYEKEVKYVVLGELWGREPTGKVSRWLFTDKGGDEICTQLDKYDTMADVLALVSVEVGSCTLMTSRGVGRDLYNTHIAIDKGRNLISDQCYLSGLVAMKKGADAKPSVAALTVMHPVVIVAQGYDVVKEAAIPANIEAFFSLDRHITSLAELQIGVFLPGQIMNPEGEARTASEVNYVASIDSQLREGILNRWFQQYCKIVERMQKIICHPEHIAAAAVVMKAIEEAKLKTPNVDIQWATTPIQQRFTSAKLQLPSFFVSAPVPKHLDEEAIGCCISMMKDGLSPEDILLMAILPAQELLADTSAQYATAMDMVATRYAGNPMVDQPSLVKKDISSKVGAAVAEELVIPTTDNTIQAEATRMQLMEMRDLLAGTDLPISPRDDDMIHMAVIVEKVEPVLASLPGNALPETTPGLQLLLNHFANHLTAAKQKGIQSADLDAYQQKYNQAASVLGVAAAQIGNTPATKPPGNAVPAAAVAKSAPILPSQGAAGAVDAAANPPRPTPP